MNGFVELPQDVQLGIIALVGAVVAFVLQWLIALVPWLAFLDAYKEEWANLLAAAIITWLQNALPTGSDEIAVLAIKLVLALLALLGFFRKFAASRNVKGFV